MRHSLRCQARWGAAVAVVAALAGCSSLTPRTLPPPIPSVQHSDPAAVAVAGHLKMMARLNQAGPAEQAEIFRAAEAAAALTPTTQDRLSYALALATPGHGAADADLARQQLALLLASSETMMPAEHALALLMLRNVEQRLVLQAENKRLQEEANRLEQEHNSSNNKRLQAQIEENAQLRKALAEAQAKLDEITRVERALTERTPPAKK